MSIDLHAAALVAVIAVVTILLRFAPFAVFGGGRPTPRYVVYLGRVLPGAIMAMLVGLLPAQYRSPGPQPRPARTAGRGRRGGAAVLAEKYAAEHRGRHRLLYDSGAADFCIKKTPAHKGAGVFAIQGRSASVM